MNDLAQYFTADERALMDKRTTGDFTPKQSLHLIELQTRWHLYAMMAEGVERQRLLDKCAVIAAEIEAADFVNGHMNALNLLGQTAIALHSLAVTSAKAHPR